MKDRRIKRSGGFTMLEMMIVVVIIGVFASMAAPSFMNWIPKMKLKADAREKVNYLRQARSLAISENSQFGVFFDIANNQIVYFKDTASPELAMYNEGTDSLLKAPIACVSNAYLDNCSFTNNAVVFYSNGSASTSGAIELINNESPDSYTINVLASTGRIRLQ
jgi:prepilin-type N-terminal cleavage/methylation domain-containing protein